MLVAMPSAKAILQSLTATGALTAIEPGSLVETALGLRIGDPFLAVAVYDDALLSGLGSEAVELNPTVNPGSSFGLNIADVLLFDETDEVDFGSGFPQLEFVDGTFDRFNFISSPFDVAGAPVAAEAELDPRVRRCRAGRAAGAWRISPDQPGAGQPGLSRRPGATALDCHQRSNRVSRAPLG